MEEAAVINLQTRRKESYNDEWNMELFTSPDLILANTTNEIENKICNLASQNSIIDFYRNGFPIKKLAYGITDIKKDADPNNKFFRGYIDIVDIFGLKSELDTIFYNNDLIRNKEASNHLLEKVKKDGLYTYKGKYIDKETGILYCRWFQIKPASKEDTVFISITSMKGKENDTGMVIPIEQGKSISVNVSYFDLKKTIHYIVEEYTAYNIFSYFNKEMNFTYNK